jgi:putative endopeptidase
MTLVVGGDPKQPTINRLVTIQSGLGLPDRDYYLKREPNFAKARAAYLTYMETLLQLGGDVQAAAHAQAVMALETTLARVQWSAEDSQDAIKTFNPMTMPVLARHAPGLDWAGFFRAAALPEIDRLSVQQPSYARAMARLVQSTPIDTWRLYQRVRLMDAQASVLPKPWRDAAFTLRDKALRGQEVERPRWQKATAAVDTALGEAVGQVYVARHFSPEAKAPPAPVANQSSGKGEIRVGGVTLSLERGANYWTVTRR